MGRQLSTATPLKHLVAGGLSSTVINSWTAFATIVGLPGCVIFRGYPCSGDFSGNPTNKKTHHLEAMRVSDYIPMTFLRARVTYPIISGLKSEDGVGAL